MKRVILFLFLSFAAGPAGLAQAASQTTPPAAVQNETHIGDFFFQVPADWKPTQAGNSMFLFAPDLTPNTATDIVLTSYAMDTSLRATFSRVWTALQRSYRVTQAGDVQMGNSNGMETALITANLDDKAGTHFIALELLIRNGNRAESILYMTSDILRAAADQQTLAAFLGTLHFSGQTQAPQGAQAGSAQSSGATAPNLYSRQTITTNSPAARGPLAGIYRAAATPGSDPASALQSWDPTTKTPNYSFLVFFPDGRVRKGLPTQALSSYIDESAMRLDVSSGGIIAAKWGTYQLAGAQGQIVFVTREVWPIVAYQDRLEINGVTYLPMDGGAGMRLVGTYKPYGDAKSPGITFTPDGEFDDEGILDTDTAMAVGMVGGGVAMGYGFGSPGPGRGTYQVSNFGVTLHYANGQARLRHFFTSSRATGAAALRSKSSSIIRNS